MNHSSLRIWKNLGAALLIAGGLGACGGDDGGSGSPDAGGGGVTSGTYNHFANSQLKIGSSANEANGYAFDLDGVAGKDNSLGGVLAGLNGTLMIDAAIQSALTAGDFVILHSVRADSLTSDTTVSWQIWLGAQQAMPKYDGSGTFTVATNAPRDAIINGTITDGKFVGGPARVTLELSLLPDSAPLRVEINAARLEANVTATGCTSGRLGGAIKADTLTTQIVPLLSQQLNARITADGTCKTTPSTCSSSNKLILDFFDAAPKDQVISETELKMNVLIQAVFTPDVDVLKADGSAGSDGTKESVSLALGFQCVKGTYTAPTETP